MRMGIALGVVAAGVIAPAALASAGTGSVPAPTGTTSVVTVKTGGDRDGANSVAPLAGVVLALDTTGGTQTGTCTSDDDGDCSFIVAGTQAGGANNGARFVVRQISAPAGWYTNPVLRTGSGSGSNSVSTPYEFTTPALDAGHVYSSQSDFMHSDDKTLLTASGGVWQDSRENPPLPRTCGLDAALVLDLSASVGSDLPFLKHAANTFVDALTGTPSRVAVFSFSGESPSTGTVNHPGLMPVSTAAGADAVKKLYADWQLGAGTNWDQALYAPARATQRYGLVVMITDGNPTYYGDPRQGTSSYTTLRDTENGVFSANALKAKGTRLVALGVGKGVEGISGLNLRAISGPQAYAGDPATADYFQTTDYTGASQALHQIALTHCSGSLSVVKQLVPAGTGENVSGAVNAGAGWEFTASTGTSGVTGLPATRTTTDDGTGSVVFQPGFEAGTSSAAVTVQEKQHAGHELVTQGDKHAVCRDLGTDEDLPVSNSGATGFTVRVAATQAVSCTVYNRPSRTPAAARIVVHKTWVVNGRAFGNGHQPHGLRAFLSLTGPGGSSASAQPWGEARGGYTSGERVRIGERVELPRYCTADTARLTRANGTAVRHTLPHRVTLARELNTFKITNKVTCFTSGLASVSARRPILPITGGYPVPWLAAIALVVLIAGSTILAWSRPRKPHRRH